MTFWAKWHKWRRMSALQKLDAAIMPVLTVAGVVLAVVYQLV